MQKRLGRVASISGTMRQHSTGLQVSVPAKKPTQATLLYHEASALQSWHVNFQGKPEH